MATTGCLLWGDRGQSVGRVLPGKPLAPETAAEQQRSPLTFYCGVPQGLLLGPLLYLNVFGVD